MDVMMQLAAYFAIGGGAFALAVLAANWNK